MLERKSTLIPGITPEFDQACDTYDERLQWMLDQGWDGKFVAISGHEILDHCRDKRSLVMDFASLALKKKLLVRKVAPKEPEDTIEIF